MVLDSSLLPSLLASGFFAACAVSIGIVLRELDERSPTRWPRRRMAILSALNVLLWIACFLSILFVFRYPLSLMASALGTAAFLGFIYRLRADETRSANQLARLVAKHGGSIHDALESFSLSCRSRVRHRVREFVYRLRCGEALEHAAFKSKLSLEPATLALLRQTNLASADKITANESDAQRREDNLATRDETLELRCGWPVSGQLLYLGLLLLMALGIGAVADNWVLASLRDMLDELGISSKPSRYYSSEVWWSIATVLTAILAIWLMLVVAASLFPFRWLLRVTPWFGSWLTTRHRSNVLQSLAVGMDRGESLSDMFDSLAKSTRSRFIRWRSRDANRRIARGEKVPAALQRSGWATRAEARWLAAAESNRSLHLAFAELSQRIRRRFDMRWQLRLAWLVPSVTLVVGGMTFVQALQLFHFLTEAIHACAS